MYSSLFALNPSLNNNLGSSLKDFDNTIWSVGRPALPCPTLSSKTLTHIFMPTCCLCYGEGAIASDSLTFPLTYIRKPPHEYSNLPKTIASRKTRDTAFRLAVDKKLSSNLKNFSNYEDRIHSKIITLQKKKDQTILTPKKHNVPENPQPWRYVPIGVAEDCNFLLLPPKGPRDTYFKTYMRLAFVLSRIITKSLSITF